MKKKTSAIDPSFSQSRVEKMLHPYSRKRTLQVSVMRKPGIKNPR
jgi:hypothetical protein